MLIWSCDHVEAEVPKQTEVPQARAKHLVAIGRTRGQRATIAGAIEHRAKQGRSAKAEVPKLRQKCQQQ